MTIQVRRRAAAVLAMLSLTAVSIAARAGDLPQMPESLGNVTIPDKPADAHWVWLGDFQGAQYARSILYDVGTGAMLGSIDMGWEGIKPDFPRSGDEIYNLAMYMSRGYRGVRTDAITAYDRHTLKPLREIVVPAKGIHGWPDINHTALSDDDRFMLMQFFTPASSIGVADLKQNKFVGEIETSGCAHVMAAGPRLLFTLCGDGSALAITLDDNGNERSRKRFTGLFDPDADPIRGSGTRVRNSWYFVSFLGKVHEVRIEGDQLRFVKPWNVAEKDGDKTWIPSALIQTVAVHEPSGQLYLLMHPSDLKPKGGGIEYHREDGTEVWAFDLKSGKRTKRLPLVAPGAALAVSQDSAPLLYVTSTINLTVDAYVEADGRHLRAFKIPGYPTLIQPVR